MSELTFRRVLVVRTENLMDRDHPNIERGRSFNGTEIAAPEVGKCYIVHYGGNRVLTTTPVTELTDYGFRTKNSEYEVDYL